MATTQYCFSYVLFLLNNTDVTEKHFLATVSPGALIVTQPLEICEESCHYESSTMVMRTENPHMATACCKKTALCLWKTLFILNVSVIVKIPIIYASHKVRHHSAFAKVSILPSTFLHFVMLHLQTSVCFTGGLCRS